MFRSSVLLISAAAVVLTGCGKAEKKAAGKPAEKAIYMSTGDCADDGKLSADACAVLIDRAVKTHEATAATYQSLLSCEKATGIDRCEKGISGAYRMRLQAFMFEISAAASSAKPLYPSAGGAIGFRDSAKAAVDVTTDGLIVTQAALSAAHDNAKMKK